ncbi:HD domain-containing protein [Autumnicola musiva]|uniref:HD domain-containing protein n=1 Tax=Autumnicola musiva TaxID=3075589 RepID=A0ABU3D286_9FLAO|nr:HD domain-containing protein [Zunongwangia sp. F117]MDT0675632.1 HD domain-containing protein [Zunongwangia sp. F117]
MEDEALEFAQKAHGDQQRKYTKELYMEHPKRVAEIVRTVPHSSEMICAAYLHDVVEDTGVSLQDIQRKFGRKIAGLVHELTDEFTKENYQHLNRRQRKNKEVERQANISAEAKTIKLADVVDNTRDIVKNNPGFARRYVPEMFALTKALQGGNFELLMRACYEVQRAKFILQGRLKE